MNLIRKNPLVLIVTTGAFALAMLGIMFFAVKVADANPSQFTETSQTASATSTLVYMTPGTATSTLPHDSYRTSTGNNYANSLTELFVQFSASSTGSQLNINLEYSNGYPGVDCITTPGACDWYQDTGTNVKGFSTTTTNVFLTNVPQYQWKFASSTVGQAALQGSNNRDTRALAVNAPARYVRAIFTCAVGGTNCAVWGQFVPIKEIR